MPIDSIRQGNLLSGKYINLVDRMGKMCYFLFNIECVDEEVLQIVLSESAWQVGMHRNFANGRFGADSLNNQ